MVVKNILFCMTSCVIFTVSSIETPDFAPLAVAIAGDLPQLQTIQYTAHCKDLNSQCSGWATAGECTFNPIWMNLNCQESCKICHVGDKNMYCGLWAKTGACTRNSKFMITHCVPSCFRYGMGTKSGDDRVQTFFNDAINRKPEQRNYSKDPPDFAPLAAAGNEQQLQTMQYIAYCKDQNDQCSGWAKRGDCTFNPIWMNLNCQESCKVCHDGDKELYCGYWARRGECTKNPKFMNITCAPSCSKYASSKRSSDNRAEKFFLDVINWKPEQRNYSKDSLDWAPLVAETADDEQPWKYPGSVTAFAYCKDQNSNCARWAKEGECTFNPIYMMLNCQGSCKICHDGDKDLQCVHRARNLERCTTEADFMINNCLASCYRYGKCKKSGDDLDEELLNDMINGKPEGLTNSIDSPYFASLAVSKDAQPCQQPRWLRFSAACKDLVSVCSDWAKRGVCATNPIYMNLYCQDSCKVCHDGDKNIYCGYLERRGDCTKYRDWMISNCAASCSRYFFAMQSMNYNTYYVGMKNGNEAWIIEDSSQNFKKFEEVQGLVYQNPVKTTATGNVVSFKWENNFYLRHYGYKFYFEKPPVNDAAALQQFNRDASFVITRDGSYFRLESENFPGYYMRHDAFRLWLEKETQGQLFKDVSNFKKIFLH